MSARNTESVDAARRRFLKSSLLAVSSLPALSALTTSSAAADDAGDAGDTDPARQLADLEAKFGGRLGVALLDKATGKHITHRGDERFPMCSTSKFLSAACILSWVDRKQESLARRVAYSRDILVAHSPVTEKHAGKDRLTIGEICEAAITQSDNTAANLMLDSFGGPAKLTAYLRAIGDPVTRLDRREPELNTAIPGDPRDTTTPAAMLADLHYLLLGKGLSANSRAQLTAWMVANQTGGQRLRAGVPKDWRVADKTGSGDHGVTNDIGMLFPPHRPPILVTAYYAESTAPADARDAVIAEVGRIAAALATNAA